MSRDNSGPVLPSGRRSPPGETSLVQRVRRAVIGPARPLDDKGLFHKVSLVALLAWVGLGADGLSSSAYGPDEAFRAVGSHTYLLLGLAAVTALTVIVISIAYSRVIEHFPHGGGGYVVATKLLGEKAGVVSGCALLVDYVLTITISIAAAGDALFSFLPPGWAAWKLPVESVLIGGMIVLNLARRARVGARAGADLRAVRGDPPGADRGRARGARAGAARDAPRMPRPGFARESRRWASPECSCCSSTRIRWAEGRTRGSRR